MRLRTFQVEEFVISTFVVGDELKEWVPDDWTANPAFVQKIADPEIKKWAIELNRRWRNLSRKMDDAVSQNPDVYSIIYVPNAFVVPGK